GPREVTEETLTEYRHYLKERYALAPSSVEAHISTIRARLRALRKPYSLDPRFTGSLLYPTEPNDHSPRKRCRTLDEFIEEQRAHGEWPSEEESAEIRADAMRQTELKARQTPRLDSEQAESLLLSPGLDTRMGKRDSAVIGLLTCTGIRPDELTRLEVSDLNHELNGQLALRIPRRDGSTD